MTASEWAERARSGEKLTMADVNRLIADLAEMERSNRINLDALAESERQAIGGDGTTHWYWRDEAERLQAEVKALREQMEREKTAVHEWVPKREEEIAALRRDLGEVQRRSGDWEKWFGVCEHERDAANAKLAAMALDNARKDAALKHASKAFHYMLSAEEVASICSEVDSALSSTPDALAQEVREYIMHKDVCAVNSEDVPRVCTCGLDALLAKLGGIEPEPEQEPPDETRYVTREMALDAGDPALEGQKL